MSNQNLNRLQEMKVKSHDKKELEDIDKSIAIELENMRKENMEKELDKIKTLKQRKGNVAAIFNVKETNWKQENKPGGYYSDKSNNKP